MTTKTRKPTMADLASLGEPDADRSYLTRRERRLIDTAAELAAAPIDGDEDPAYLHTVLAQCGLPYRRPPDTQTTYERRNGRASLLITSGQLADPYTQRWEQQGLPYGSRARLILIDLCSRAVTSQSPEIEIGDSMSSLMKTLGLAVTGGSTGTITQFKAQLQRLAAANVQLGMWNDQGAVTINARTVERFEAWFPKDSSQQTLWASTITLDERFFRTLKAAAVPLAPGAIRALAHSPLCLDIYTFLAHRLARVPVGKGAFIPWARLHEQFGPDTKQPAGFRRNFLHALNQVVAVYPRVCLNSSDEGLRLFHSPPPVEKSRD